MASELGVVYLKTKLEFDPVSEAYIAQEVSDMAYHRTIADQIERLLKLSADNPECLNRPDVLRQTLEQIRATGLTPRAAQFYDSALEEIKEIKGKVNQIYEMCLQMYTTAQFAEVIGLKEKTVNIAKAEFMLEMQINRICQAMKIHDYSVFKSGSYVDLESKSSLILEYIIQHYSSIVDEYRKAVEAQNSTKEMTNQLPPELLSQLVALFNQRGTEQAPDQVPAKVPVTVGASPDREGDQMREEELKESVNNLNAGEIIDLGDTRSGSAYSPEGDYSAASHLLNL